MRLLFAAGLMALMAACQPSAPAGPTAEEIAAESKKLTDYLNAEFEEELAMNPTMLTQMGRKELYDQLGDFSEADAAKQLEWRRESVAGMKAAVDPAKLSDDAMTSWAIWESELERSETRAKWQRHAYVFGFGGPHTDIPNFLITEYFVNFEARGREIARPPFEVKAGYITVPMRPGLGIELDEAALARFPARGSTGRTMPAPGDEAP